MTLKKILFILLVSITAFLFYVFDLASWLSLQQLQEQKSVLLQQFESWPLGVLGLYALVYILVTALSLPGAAILSLAGGAVFGLYTAFFVVSFASTIGATLAFLLSRYFFRDWVSQHFSTQYEKFEEGFEKEGKLYLLGLRLMPVFPFFMVNLVMGLTKMPVVPYYWVSQIAMIPATFLFVRAGTQLGEIRQLSDILSLDLVLTFSLIGLLPIIAGKMLELLKNKKKSI